MEYDQKTMISVTEVKDFLRKRSYGDSRLIIVDTSDSNYFGYSFALIREEKISVEYDDSGIWKEVERLIESKTIYNPNIRNNIGDMGAYQSVFDRKAVMEILKK